MYSPDTTVDVAKARLLSTSAACEYLGGLSTRGFYDFKKRWKIPEVRILPQTIRFDKSDLDAAIDRAKEESCGESRN